MLERPRRPIGSSRRRRPRPPVAPDPARRGPMLGDEELSERVTLIEFEWIIRSGVQQVILASRELLH